MKCVAPLGLVSRIASFSLLIFRPYGANDGALLCVGVLHSPREGEY